MTQLSLRPLAQRDLLKIWSYVAQSSERNAEKLITQFHEKFQLLVETPYIGRDRPELPTGELRSFPVGSYIIYYTPITEGIEVVRVLHMKRDVRPLLSEPESDGT